jgi:type IV pilus assembly protein PilA
MTPRQAEPSGFSLIELLIVLAVVFCIVAIALPHLMTARDRANEASAVASLKAVHAAEMIYQNNYPTKGYSPSLANLGNNGSTCETTSSTNACLIDSALASGMKDGYLFDLLGDGETPDKSYTLKATPLSASSGGCSFYTDQSGVIQYGTGPATPGLSSGGTSGGSSRCSGNL